MTVELDAFPLCSQCGELPGAMLKLGTTDLWCIDCLDEAAESGLRERIESIETHNGTPPSPDDLRWAATHEALARPWIFDVLMGLADALDTPTRPGLTDGVVETVAQCGRKDRSH